MQRYKSTDSAIYRHKGRAKAARGFTMVELLISMAISVIAILAAMSLVTKFARGAAAASEVGNMEEVRGITETLLRADLDGAGYNLTRPSPSLAGTIFVNPTAFNSYNWSNGTITKTGPSGWENGTPTTHALGSGLGSFNFTPPGNGGTAYIYGPNGDSFTIIVGFGEPNIGVWMAVYVNGVEVASTCCASPSQTIPAHLVGDSYIFRIENGTSQRLVKLYRVRHDLSTALWTAPAPSYPIAFGLNVYGQGQSFTNVKITGAPLVPLDWNVTEFAPLPYDKLTNTRLTGPITTTGGGSGITALAGDRAADTITTTADFNSSSSQIVAHFPNRGSFQAGDYVLITDWGSRDPATPGGATSALCQVAFTMLEEDNPLGNHLTMFVDRVTTDNPAFNRLYSSDADHQHTFPAGSTVTKLQAPVSYALSSDSRLVRIEGDRASTVAFKLRRARFVRYVEFNSTATIFQVDITMAAEGVETGSSTSDENRNTIEFRARPRALNLASNQLN